MGSTAMLNAAEEDGKGSTHIFGVGSFGSGPSNMGKCFEVTISSTSKKGLFQVVNEGADVSSGQFDVQMGAGGFGMYNGCASPTTSGASPMFGVSSSVFGDTYGGIK